MAGGRVAVGFPGQGSQEAGMGRAMAEAFPAARAVYARASEALGFDVAERCFSWPLERLSATEITQPTLTATSLACLAAVREATGLVPDVVVGHSVGEYAALAAAGATDDATAVRLTHERGLATAAAAAEAPGAMAAVIGLDDAAVEALCAGIDGVWPANYNCPGQLVVSGTVEGVERLVEEAGASGARRALRLKVSGGFHSPLTAAAEGRLRPVLEATPFAEPSIPFLSATTCRVEPAEAIVPLLLRQLTAPVRFTQAVEELVRMGVDTFVEVGPGSVLAGLVRRIDRGVRTVSVGDPAGLEKLEVLLRG